MKKLTTIIGLSLSCCLAISVQAQVNTDLSEEKKKELSQQSADVVETAIGELRLVAPFSSESVTKESEVIGWGDKKPQAPAGFKVTKFAENLKHPRRTYIAPNGDIFVG